MSGKRSLVFCGDIHGELPTLVFNLVERYKIKDASVIICGDFGAGFGGKDVLDKTYKKYSKRLEENDITIYALRGNHDNPEYFIKPEENGYDYPRLKFLEDHKVYNIEGRRVYTIGGANSVDFIWRQEWNSKHKSKIWWEDEDIVKLPIDKLPTGTVDVIVSHEAPLAFSPIPSRPEELDSEQYGKILASRTYLNEILENMNTKYWFYGHYHTSYSGSYNNIIWRCLNIHELFMLPDEKEMEVTNESSEK